MQQSDTYSFQRARVERIVGELALGKDVRFAEPSPFIKFYVRDSASGTALTESSGDWLPEQLAGKSDDWLRAFIKRLSNGKI